jgi:hypothetical protein
MQCVEEQVGAGRGFTSTKVLAPVSEGSLILIEAGLMNTNQWQGHLMFQTELLASPSPNHHR